MKLQKKPLFFFFPNGYFSLQKNLFQLCALKEKSKYSRKEKTLKLLEEWLNPKECLSVRKLKQANIYRWLIVCLDLDIAYATRRND